MKIFNKIVTVLAAMGLVGFSFAQEGVTLPFNYDFEENSDGWVFLNSSEGSNHWYRGNGAQGNSTYSLYISDNNGTSNQYDQDKAQVSHAYLPVNFTATGDFELKFRVVCEGEEGYDMLQVALLDAVPEQDMNLTSAKLEIADQSYWTTKTLLFTVAEPGTKYVVFSWKNDGSGGEDAPAIDDVEGNIYLCAPPTGLSSDNITASGFTLSWVASETAGVTNYVVEQQEGYSGSWVEVGRTASTSLEITGLKQNTRYYYRVKAEIDAQNYSQWTDGSFSVVTDYSCPAPTDMAVLEQEDGCLFSWTSSASEFEIYYKKSTDQDYQMIKVSGVNEYLFTDWVPSAIYNLKVRAICTEGDTSIYSNEYIYATECGVMELPYLEDFDLSHWEGNNLLCWTIVDNNNDGVTWESNTDYDGNTCVKYRYSSSNPGDDYLISPKISLSKNSQLSFKINTVSASYPEKFAILLSTTTKDVDAFTEVLVAEKEIVSNVPVVELADLSAYTGQEVYIALKVCSDANQYGLQVDDFSIVTCPAPGGLRLAERPDAISSSSAWIDLDVPASGEVVLEYKASADETWVVLEKTSSFPVQLSGLQSNTAYQVRAKTICGPEEESFYSSEFTFTTPCNALPFPYMENFNLYTEGEMPSCWQLTDQSGVAWQIGSDYSSYFFEYEGSNMQHCNAVSPVIDLSSADISRLQLEMEYAHPYLVSGDNVFSMSISTDGGGSWDTVRYDFTQTAQTEVVIPLTEYVSEGATQLQVRLEGKGNSNAYGGFKVYYLNIVHAPICFPPTHIQISELTAYSVNIQWNVPENGTPEQYQLIYQKEDDEATVDTLYVEGSAAGKEITGLEPQTSYMFRLSTICTEEPSADTVFYVKTPVSCPSVDKLRLSEIGVNRAVIVWDYATDAEFEFEYKLVTDMDWTPVQDVMAKTVTLEDLSSNTAYQVRVRVVCADDDMSVWSEISFNTACEAVEVPYEEGFEEPFVGNVPACWTYVKVSGEEDNAQWGRWAPGKEGGYGMRFNAYDLRDGYTASAVSPLIRFDADALYTLDFWILRNAGCTKPNEGVKVFLSQNHDTVGAELVAYIHSNHDLSPVVTEPAEDNWYHYSYELPYVSEEAYIIFYGISEWGYDIMIDAVKVEALKATDIKVSAISEFHPMVERNNAPVSIELINEGVGDYVGDLTVAYQLEDDAVVTETVHFTEEEPLYSNTPYRYDFQTGITTSEKGELKLCAWYTMGSGSDMASDTIRTVLVNYEAMELPYSTKFDGTASGDKYGFALDHNEDGYGWQTATSLEFVSNPEKASDDSYVVAGTALAEGEMVFRLDFGVETPDEKETLTVLLENLDGKTDTLEVFENMNFTRDTNEVFFRNDAAGFGNIRFHVGGEPAHSKLNVYGLELALARVFESMEQSICEGEVFQFGDEELTQAGVYVDTVKGVHVDTVFSLTLMVNPSYGFSLDTAICEGQTIEFGGEVYSEAGTFTKEYTTVNGCDSIYTLNLTLRPVAAAPIITQKDEAQDEVILVATTPEKMVQWYNTEGAIDGATEKEYKVEVNGIYHATASNECGESEPSNKIEVKLTSVEGDQAAPAPVLYPNPTRDYVWFKAQEEMRSIEIYSAHGRLIQRLENCGKQYQLDVQNQVGGTYIVKVKTGSGLYTYKMVVNK